MLEFVHGDLLLAPAEALVNAVNTVGVMGKGIALQFKRAFPTIFAAYARACEAGTIAIGSVFAFDTGLIQPRWILNLPTKRHWRQPSRLEDVQCGIAALAATIQRERLGSVAVPALGCGAGDLSWSVVRPLIEEGLGSLTSVKVLVYGPAEGLPAASP